jgi:hypothetical protein
MNHTAFMKFALFVFFTGILTINAFGDSSKVGVVVPHHTSHFIKVEQKHLNLTDLENQNCARLDMLAAKSVTPIPVLAGTLFTLHDVKIEELGPMNKCGYRIAEGQSLVKSDYDELFQSILCKYGCDQDDFNLPDLREKIK